MSTATIPPLNDTQEQAIDFLIDTFLERARACDQPHQLRDIASWFHAASLLMRALGHHEGSARLSACYHLLDSYTSYWIDNGTRPPRQTLIEPPIRLFSTAAGNTPLPDHQTTGSACHE